MAENVQTALAQSQADLAGTVRLRDVQTPLTKSLAAAGICILGALGLVITAVVRARRSQRGDVVDADARMLVPECEM